MINSRLLPQLREPRERHHGRRAGIGARLRKRRADHERAALRALDHGVPGAAFQAPPPGAESAQAHLRPTDRADREVERVRDAGGPVDKAAYACQCGYQFSAAVSTTVACPHCGAGQAW